MVNRDDFKKAVEELTKTFPTQFDTGKHVNRTRIELPPGWLALFIDLCAKVDLELAYEIINERRGPHEIGASFQWLQLKEKFGTLRAYYRYTGQSEKIRELVDEAENLSSTTCCVCGEGEASMCNPNGGWMLTLCKTHNVKGVKFYDDQ